jgi:hypothetical protein
MISNAAIVHEGTFIANSGSPPTVSVLAVNSVTSGTDQLYLASVSIFGSGVTVSSISGGGLTWTLQKSQCSERLTSAKVEVWQAFGSPGATFNTTVTLSGAAVVSAAVSRYSGADTTTPTQGAAGSNTGGMNGACPGTGTDDLNLSLSLTSSQNDSFLYVASHPRNKLLEVADDDVNYTRRAGMTNADGGDGASLYVHDRSLATAGTDSADHALVAGRETSWDMAGLVINPAAAGGAVLLVVGDKTTPSAQDAAKKTLIESWGYTVTMIDDAESQAAFDAAVATSDVAYVSEEVSSSNVGTKLTGACIGVLNEEADLLDELGISSTYGSFTSSTIDITDNSHYITSPFSTGSLTIASLAQELRSVSGTIAGGAQALAEQPASANVTLTVIEAGGALTSPPGGTAAGRRVKPPWGGNAFDINTLDTNGQLMMRRTIEWGASGGACSATPAVTSAVAEISPNDVATSSTANAFSYDIQATIGGGDTGVDTVAITVPAGFGAPTITGVQVDGVGVAYTNNTTGNAISVDLTTKVTASSKLTVLFNADAPITQDLTGVTFLSTVDDSGTGDVAQSTTEGNGDGNAGDLNSWTVTTTTGRLPGCGPRGLVPRGMALPQAAVHRRRRRFFRSDKLPRPGQHPVGYRSGGRCASGL